jgi:hypothetical protein
MEKSNVYNPRKNLVENINESIRNKTYEIDLYNRRFKFVIKKGVMMCSHCTYEITDIYTHCMNCKSFSR